MVHAAAFALGEMRAQQADATDLYPETLAQMLLLAVASGTAVVDSVEQDVQFHERIETRAAARVEAARMFWACAAEDLARNFLFPFLLQQMRHHPRSYP